MLLWRQFSMEWKLYLRDRGATFWTFAFPVLMLLGFGLILWGYGLARQQPVVLWLPPVTMRHIATLLTLFVVPVIYGALARFTKSPEYTARKIEEWEAQEAKASDAVPAAAE